MLTLPARPHARVEPPKRSDDMASSVNVRKPAVVPFDGAYWYSKLPDARLKADAHREEGDPIKANVRSTDRRELAMEAHQMLASSLSGDCCRGIRLDLLNGDDRVGVIQVELLPKDTSEGSGSLICWECGDCLKRESTHFTASRACVRVVALYHAGGCAGRWFDEIAVVIRPSSERALAGSKVAV